MSAPAFHGRDQFRQPLELTERLAALVPPFRANQLRYAGILAGNAAWRGEVVPTVPSSTDAEREARARQAPRRRAAGMGRASKEGVRR